MNVIFPTFGPLYMSVQSDLTSGHLRHHLVDVPRQPNSPPDCLLTFITHKNNFSLSLSPVCKRELLLINIHAETCVG